MKYHYIRNLPHYQVGGYSFFITSRLCNTIPRPVYKKIKAEYEENVKYISEMNDVKKKATLYSQIQIDEFLKYEQILHSLTFGRQWLRNDHIAKIVSDSLRFHDTTRYNLFAFTIMPNHFHVILQPKQSNTFTDETKLGKDYFSLENIMRSIKGYSGKEANKYLNRTGAFWQHENYDHIIRNKDELFRTINYTLNNPVKAGLCKNADEWKWNYFNPQLLE